METAHYGKIVAIDIDTESYIIADNALAASERLLKQYPKAEIWCVRVGHRALHRIGGRHRSVSGGRPANRMYNVRPDGEEFLTVEERR